MKDCLPCRYIIWSGMVQREFPLSRKGKGRWTLKKKKEHRRSGSSWRIRQGYEGTNFCEISQGKIPPPFSWGSLAWQSAKQPRRSLNHLAQLTENGTTASVLELLLPSLSLSLLKKEKKKEWPEHFSVVDKLVNIMIDCLVTRTRMCLLYCSSPQLSGSEYSEPNKLGFAHEFHSLLKPYKN